MEAGQGTPVILVHGGAVGGADAWRTQLSLAARWRLIIPTRLNYPDSATSEREDFAADGLLLAELAAAQPGGAHLVGQSYGAVGAMLAALRQPDAVLSLTLVESADSGVARHLPRVAEFERRMRALVEQPPDDLEDRFLAMFSLIDPGARFPTPLPPRLLHFAGRIGAGIRWPWEADIDYDALRAAPFRKLVISGGERAVSRTSAACWRTGSARAASSCPAGTTRRTPARPSTPSSRTSS